MQNMKNLFIIQRTDTDVEDVMAVRQAALEDMYNRLDRDIEIRLMDEFDIELVAKPTEEFAHRIRRLAEADFVYVTRDYELRHSAAVERRLELIYAQEHGKAIYYQDGFKFHYNFGAALVLIKRGTPMTREGWNGKGLRVVYQKGYPEGIKCNKQTAEAWGINEGDMFRVEPYLQINTVDGSHAMWVPSIRDIMANDWIVAK